MQFFNRASGPHGYTTVSLLAHHADASVESILKRVGVLADGLHRLEFFNLVEVAVNRSLRKYLVVLRHGSEAI